MLGLAWSAVRILALWDSFSQLFVRADTTGHRFSPPQSSTTNLFLNNTFTITIINSQPIFEQHSIMESPESIPDLIMDEAPSHSSPESIPEAATAAGVPAAATAAAVCVQEEADCFKATTPAILADATFRGGLVHGCQVPGCLGSRAENQKEIAKGNKMEWQSALGWKGDFHI
jgi:hypothetical protein